MRRGTWFQLVHWNLPSRAEQTWAFERLKPFLAAQGMHLEEESLPPRDPTNLAG